MNLPDELVQAFADGDGTLFIGAGVSMGAGLPSWGELINRLIGEIDGCPEGSSYQDIAQYYVNEHGPHRLAERLRQELRTLNLAPTTVHEALLRLPTNPIFTTNYDNLLEKALEVAGRDYNLVITSVDTSFWSNTKLQLVKLHGDLGTPDSIVITAEHYERYVVDRSALARLLLVALQTRTMLFLGYSATDPDFRQLLTQVRNETREYTRNAFAVMFEPSKPQITDLNRRHIRVINLPCKSTEVVSEQHTNQLLTAWLNELASRIQSTAPVTTLRPAWFLPKHALPSEPYKFLDFFTSKDAGIFRGRERETARLRKLIDAERISILYGDSGTGKTSLIHAAVIPALKEESYAIATLRVQAQPARALREEICKILGIEMPAIETESSLSSILDGGLVEGTKLLLVIDQFEEFFIRNGPETRRHFIRELVEALHLPNRSIRCLISLRSDYLDKLDDLQEELGLDPLQNRMRLRNLGPAEAGAAIAEPAAAFKIRIESSLLEQLLSDLEESGIAPPQLQVVCYELWQDWMKRGKLSSGLTLARYFELGGTRALLANYLENVIAELSESDIRDSFHLELEPKAAQEAARVVLKSMISGDRTKLIQSGREITNGEVVTRLGITPAQAEGLMRYLRNKRVIRRLPDSDYYELAHDVMVEKVWEWVSEDERYMLDLQDMLARATSDYLKFGSLIPVDRLNLLTDQASRLSLTEDALEMLLVSATQSNLKPELWVTYMQSDRAIRTLARLLEAPRRAYLPQIATALGYTGSVNAVRYLFELLKHENDEVQHSAAAAIGRLGLPVTVRALYHAARSERKPTRAIVIIEVLANIHNEEAVAMLNLLAVEHESTQVRQRATTSLYHLNSIRSNHLLVSLLENEDQVIAMNALDSLRILLQKGTGDFEDMLQHPDVAVRVGIVQALKTIPGSKAVNLLIVALRDADAEVRRYAVDALIEQQDHHAIEGLILALNDEDARIRRLSITAIADREVEMLVSLLLTALKDRDPAVQKVAADVLARVADKQEIWDLLLESIMSEDVLILGHLIKVAGEVWGDISLLRELIAYHYKMRWSVFRAFGITWQLRELTELGNENHSVRANAAKKLGARRGQALDQRLVEALIISLGDPLSSVRIRVINTLRQLALERAATEIMPLLKDEDAAVRSAAAEALGQLGGHRVQEALLITLEDEDTSVRWAAIRALGTLWNIVEVQALGSNTAQVRVQALRSLESITDAKVTELLFAMLKDPAGVVRIAAVNAASAIGSPIAIHQLRPMLKDEDALVQYVVAQGLELLGEGLAVEHLIKSLEDENKKIQIASIKALGILGQSIAVEPLTAKLWDKDVAVRIAAANALGRLGEGLAVEHLIRSLEDKNKKVQIASIKALGMLGQSIAVEPLTAKLWDKDVAVRTAAAEALGQLGGYRVQKALLATLEGKDTQVRWAAIRALGTLRNVPALVALGNVRSDIRAQAIIDLMQYRKSSFIVKLFEATLLDPDSTVRERAREALADALKEV